MTAKRIYTGPCDVEGCDRPIDELVWCHGHYERQRRGDSLGGPFLDTPAKRFWAKVDVSGQHQLWVGGKGGDGRYGMFHYQGRNRPAHVVAWLLAGNPEPEQGFDLDHLCRVTLCVDVTPLEVVTHQENILRGESIMAHNARKTHCKRGHGLTSENIRQMSTGGRACLACEGLHYLARRRGGHISDFADLDLPLQDSREPEPAAS